VNGGARPCRPRRVHASRAGEPRCRRQGPHTGSCTHRGRGAARTRAGTAERRGPKGHAHQGWGAARRGPGGRVVGGQGAVPPGPGEPRRGGEGKHPRGPRGDAPGGCGEGVPLGAAGTRWGGAGRELTSGSKSGDHRLQNLGHHGEREMRDRGSCCVGELNEGKRPGEGGAWGGAGAPGACGPWPSRAGRAAPRAKTPWHAQP
jgi:hypothetical protein